MGKKRSVHNALVGTKEATKKTCTVPKLLIRKRYYVLFLIPVFIVQVTKLVQFT
jgi:hypothetical protein